MGQTLFDELSLSGLKSRLSWEGVGGPEVGLGKYAPSDGTIKGCSKRKVLISLS